LFFDVALILLREQMFVSSILFDKYLSQTMKQWQTRNMSKITRKDTPSPGLLNLN